MKKRTKILSILLALMLTATLVPTALVQAFASDYEWEDSATSDETTQGPIKSIEITKAPDKLVYYMYEIEDTLEGAYFMDEPLDNLFNGLEMRIVLSDGTSYDYSYDNDGYWPDCPFDDTIQDEYDWDLHEVYISVVNDISDIKVGKNTIIYHYFGAETTQEITVLPTPELTSIEITKATDNTTIEKYYDGYVWARDLMDGLEMLLTFDDGTTYNYSYDEDFDTPQCFYENGIAEKYDYDIDIIDLKIKEADEDGFINNLPLGETEITYQLLGCTATQKITVLENEFILNPITKLELTKLPDKEFSAPYTKEDESNSIAYNMKGAELTISRKNGEKNVITFSEGIYKGHDDDGNAFAPYVYFTDPNSKPIFINVKDLGDYKAVFRLEITDLTLEFSVKNTGTNDNPTTPGEVINPSNPSSTVPTSSGNGTSSTSDTPANGNTSANNTSNGTVATGNAAVSAILLSVLLLAAGVMAVIGRKKQLF